MSKDLARAELLEKVDDEFGDSVSYWAVMLKIAFDAGNIAYAEELVDRCMCASMRRAIRGKKRKR